MNDGGKGPSLLDRLTRDAGCAYVSDLRARFDSLHLDAVLDTVPPQAFSPKEWEEAACYLTKERHAFDGAEGARQYLIQRARGEKSDF